MRRQQGAILPLTLIILAILAVLAISVNVQSRDVIADVRDKKQAFNDLITINNTIEEVLFLIAVGDNRQNAFQLDEERIYVDGREQTINGVQVSVQDVAGLVSLSLSTQQTLYNVMKMYVDNQQANAITQDIIGWRTPGSLTTTPLSGTTDHYLPRHSYMRSVDELLEIPGIAQGDFYNQAENSLGLRDYVVAGGVGWVNVATMPPALLMAVYGITETQLNELENARKDNDLTVFNQYLSAYGLVGEMGNVTSDQFVIKAKGKLYQAKAQYKITIGGSPPYKTLLWQYPNAARY